MKSVFDSPYHSIIGRPSLRIIGYKIGKESLNQTKLPPTPLTFLINPTLTPLDRESKWTHEYESCESLPHYNCIVKRPGKVEMKALNLDGAEVQFTVEGFLAKVLHHEMDHLEGVSLVDRMVPGTLRHDQYIDVYENYPAKK
ncbi:peptide deformylase [Rhizoclosmatium globosum]|uniref:Peptide deformylase n=1 Tax=Rhizoclosmatium globosum TaxID=329046 RepID=A0A1Y2B7K9_9FUNG|nr:peptide deformylase [Rhizoclosmatium globosum]|eukprot:ORY30714.1 peptide deformylase [Rhizoclosmatium globosum]